MIAELWRKLFKASSGSSDGEMQSAWLEGKDGRRWQVGATCAIGRSNGNDILVDDQGVSRRHALINKQGDTEYWIIDLGSGNGTLLNNRRITLSTRLADGDVLSLGEQDFTFRQTAQTVPAGAAASHTKTIINIKTVPCWLMVADIKGSTTMAAQLAPAEMAVLVGQWMDKCNREIIEAHGGTVNKYLGDGFLAYWPLDPGPTPRCLGALQQLLAMQRSQQRPKFRVALHLGQVAIGGGGSLGEASLSGLDLIFVFRMEKLAAELKCDFLASEAARKRLGAMLAFDELGQHALAGIDGPPGRFFAVG